jgi:hypothetical protein
MHAHQVIYHLVLPWKRVSYAALASAASIDWAPSALSLSSGSTV